MRSEKSKNGLRRNVALERNAPRVSAYTVLIDIESGINILNIQACDPLRKIGVQFFYKQEK